MSLSRRWFAVPVLAIAVAGVSACSSDGDSTEVYVAPLATDAPGPDALAADAAVIRYGQWGVVRYLSTEDEPTTMAIRITGVVAGEPGDLGDVTIFGVDDTDSLTPYHVSFVWANLTGDETNSPTQHLVAYGPDEPVTLSLPASERKCDPPEATDPSVGLGYEQRGCATSAASGEPPVALVFRGPAGSSEGVSFVLPPAT